MRTGDTLSSINANLWGDASLRALRGGSLTDAPPGRPPGRSPRYKLTEANGMSAANALAEGRDGVAACW